MNKKSLTIFIIALVLLGGAYVYSEYGGVIRNIKEPEVPITQNEAKALSFPNDLNLEIFATDLPGARVIVRDTFGNLLVSQTSEGKISLIELKNGEFARVNTMLSGLRKPHGLALDPDTGLMLYYSEEHQISRIALYSDGGPEKVMDLPVGAGHFTRSLGFGPDGRLYVSIGSSCNVCDESDRRRAKIFFIDLPGPGRPTAQSELKEFARGLRNTVFFSWHPITGEMWGTDMGRDNLGDDIPPDEVNLIREGGNYGWPICYGKNIHDNQFDKKTYFRNPCLEPFEKESQIDIPAHSAPLGIAFAPQDSWPEDYAGDMFIAYHGSWNRSSPTGYKVVRANMDDKGKYPSSPQDFITGWLKNGEVLGRPVDIKFFDGRMYISDDKAGVIYRLTPQ